MVNFKKRLKNILGLISITVLLTGIAVGILIKEKNNQKANSAQSSGRDYRFENRNFPDLKTEIEQTKKVCSQLLEKDENTFVFEEYSKMEVVECMFVGCGGLF